MLISLSLVTTVSVHNYFDADAVDTRGDMHADAAGEETEREHTHRHHSPAHHRNFYIGKDSSRERERERETHRVDDSCSSDDCSLISVSCR